MIKSNILNSINEADMVLIGIGEEFDDIRSVNHIEAYQHNKIQLQESKYAWIIPFMTQYELSNSGSLVMDVLKQLKTYLNDKDYFIITTSINDYILQCGFDEERIVTPCGNNTQKQCPNCCPDSITKLSDQDKEHLKQIVQTNEWEALNLGTCPVCGSKNILNNIYSENYDENGYLLQWDCYTKWIQNTLNKKLCILELGVGMQCPSVIRWPFEKIVYFNQKSNFIRVNEHLYQLNEEISSRGISIHKNAIDWLSDVK